MWLSFLTIPPLTHIGPGETIMIRKEATISQGNINS